MRPSALLLACTSLLVAFAACRHQPPVAMPTTAPLTEGHCWYSVFETDLPPDTVARHFVDAFRAMGLTGASWTQAGDTTRAHAGPTMLSGKWGGTTVAARVVAYRSGSVTHFRHFVALEAPERGWTPAPPYDSARLVSPERLLLISRGAAQIGFCTELGRAARVHGVAKPPSAEDSLKVWSPRS